MSEVLEYELPRGWCWASIEALTVYVQRGKSPKYAESSALPVLNQKCVRWHGVQKEHLKFVDPTQWEAWGPERTLRDGDILWNSTGTGTIGRAALYRRLDGFDRVVADSHVTVVRVKYGLPEYLHAWIRSPSIQGRIEAMQTGSTNQVELGRSEVLRTRVPVAPLNEQRRIVAKLEALQARSRRAREALDAVPPLLEKLRQSILAAAFRGDLTKDWRAKHKDVEPASELLKRIRTERRKKWEEAELAKMKAKGKPPTDDKWKAKYKEPAPVDTTGLPELPEGWCWARTSDVVAPGTVISYGIVLPGPPLDEGVRYIRGQDIEDGQILTEQLWRTTPEIAAAHNRSALVEGDVLLCIIRHLKVAIVPSGLDGANVTQGTVRLRPSSAILGPYLARYLEGPSAQGWMKARYFGNAMPRINVEDAREVPVPVAPIAEQEAIVVAIAKQLDAIESIAEAALGCLAHHESLDRAVLAKAFRGELVPQEPNDEPAEVVLARVRAANGTQQGGTGNGTAAKARSRRRNKEIQA